MKHFSSAMLAISAAMLLSACDDGKDGSNGTNGGNGLTSLITQTQLETGNANCWLGGIQIDSGIDQDGDEALSASEISTSSYICNPSILPSRQNGRLVGA